MQAHPTALIIYRNNESKWKGINEDPPTPFQIIDYFAFGTGRFTSNVAEVAGYIKTKFAKFNDVEDIHVHCSPMFFGNAQIIKERNEDNNAIKMIIILAVS